MPYANKNEIQLAHDSRWMMFVDGEGFTIRSQEMASSYKAKIDEGEWYMRDTFFWPRGISIFNLIFNTTTIRVAGVRSYYYTSTQGDAVKLQDVKSKLWNLGFHADAFRKDKGGKSKGVDVSLTKDMLSHAFYNNYDVAILVAGDGDFVPVVDEVKRMGKIVCVAFLDENRGLNSNLRLASDFFVPLDEMVKTHSLRWPQIEAVAQDWTQWYSSTEIQIQRFGDFLAEKVLQEAIGWDWLPEPKMIVLPTLPSTPNAGLNNLLDEAGILTSKTIGVPTAAGFAILSSQNNFENRALLLAMSANIIAGGGTNKFYVEHLRECLRTGHENSEFARKSRIDAEKAISLVRGRKVGS